MEIRWSLPAAEDLERICERIERDNPEAARHVARTIYDGCATLSDYPHLGRASSRMTGRRELVFSHLPYIVVYQVTEQAVEISRIFHGRRIGLRPAVFDKAQVLGRQHTRSQLPPAEFADAISRKRRPAASAGPGATSKNRDRVL